MARKQAEAAAGQAPAEERAPAIEPVPPPATPPDGEPLREPGAADVEAVLPPAPEPPPDQVADRLRNGALFRWGLFGGLGVAAAVVLTLAVYEVRAMVIRALVALFIAVSLDPAIRFLTRRGIRRSLAVLIITVAFIAVVAAFVISVTPPLITQGQQLAHNIPSAVTKLERGPLRGLDRRLHLQQRLSSLAQHLPTTVSTGFLDITTRVIGDVASFLIVIVLAVYFMTSLPSLQQGVRRLFPVDRRDRYAGMLDIVVEKVGDYMIGRVVVAVIAGVASFIALEIAGVAYPIPLAILIAALDIIPLVGHPIGAAVAVIVALFTTGFWPETVLLIAFFVFYANFENYVIAPRVLRTSLNISSVAVLVAALFGAALAGLVGALIAIPLGAAIKVIGLEQIKGHEATAQAEAEPAGRRSGWNWYRFHRPG